MRPLLVASLALACAVPDPDGKDDVPGETDTHTDVPAHTDTGTPPPRVAPSDLRLRHLTHDELDHVVSDLLGVQLAPSARLPGELTGEGYPSDVTLHTPTDTVLDALVRSVEHAVATMGTARPQAVARLDFEDLDSVAWADVFDTELGGPATWVAAERNTAFRVHLVVPHPGAYTLELMASRLIDPDVVVDRDEDHPEVVVRLGDTKVFDDRIHDLDYLHDPLRFDVTLASTATVLEVQLRPSRAHPVILDHAALVDPHRAPVTLLDDVGPCTDAGDRVACVADVLAPVA
ncbi:MAG: DUF1587 domain-containing protein, partial [Myxococcales bacterium]|nr:DUF1587 domain-containing protein [Myxococcales bacterium]